MTKPTLADVNQLTREVILPFHQVMRHMPLRAEPGRFEDDAQHSWSVALLACALAPHIDKSLDIGKVCQFATIHDLVEVYAGDTSNFAAEDIKATKEAREQAALERLRKQTGKFPWIAETVAAYEAQESAEAKFVKSIDKLIPLLFDYIEEGLFYHANKITLTQWQKQMQKHREKASGHQGAFVYYDELWNLLLANPHLFHQPPKTR
jgi:5'-deoxynucleotidase YfbR-like HD superfamily hydrolase